MKISIAIAMIFVCSLAGAETYEKVDDNILKTKGMEVPVMVGNKTTTATIAEYEASYETYKAAEETAQNALTNFEAQVLEARERLTKNYNEAKARRVEADKLGIKPKPVQYSEGTP